MAFSKKFGCRQKIKNDKCVKPWQLPNKCHLFSFFPEFLDYSFIFRLSLFAIAHKLPLLPHAAKKKIVTKHGYNIQAKVLNIIFYISTNICESTTIWSEFFTAKVIRFPFLQTERETKFEETNWLYFPATERLSMKHLNKSWPAFILRW